MRLLLRQVLFLYLVYVPMIMFMITPKVVYFLQQSLAVGKLLIVEVLCGNCGYHSVADYGGLVSHPYDYIAGEPLIPELLTTAGCFCGQAIKFYNAEGDPHGVIGSPSTAYEFISSQYLFGLSLF